MGLFFSLHSFSSQSQWLWFWSCSDHLTTMKTFLGASLLARILLVAILTLASSHSIVAQSETNDLGGLEMPLVNPPPQHGGTFWLLSDYYLDANGFIRFSRAPRPVIPLAD